MYPKPILDLAGWQIRSIASGFSSTIVSAKDEVSSCGILLPLTLAPCESLSVL